MSVSNFNYNDFMNLVNIEDACNTIFEESVLACYGVEIGIASDSAYMNCIMRDIAHMLRLVYNYAKPFYSPYDFSKALASIEIISKIDLKSVYNNIFEKVYNDEMKRYIRCKTFCNKLRKYLMNKISELFFENDYEFEGNQCRDLDATILKEITAILYEC